MTMSNAYVPKRCTFLLPSGKVTNLQEMGYGLGQTRKLQKYCMLSTKSRTFHSQNGNIIEKEPSESYFPGI